MANPVKGCTTGALIIGPPVPPLSKAYNGCLTKVIPNIGRPASRFQCVIANDRQLVSGAEDFSQGNPGQPSLRMDAKGTWRFRWAMQPGAHTISVNVLHAINQNPRPSMVVKNNPGIGINVDIETFAASGTGWVIIMSPLFTTSALGVTWVELRNNLETNVGASPCYWDHVVKT